MGRTPTSRPLPRADSAVKISEVGAPTRRKRCAASARCAAIILHRPPHSRAPPSQPMPHGPPPAPSFVWETGLNSDLRCILAMATANDHLARDRDLLPGGAPTHAVERWRWRCRARAPPLFRPAAGRRGAGCGRVGQAECGASGRFLGLAWCMVGGGCRLYWEGPVSPCVVSVGLVRTSALLLRSRPLQRKKTDFCFCARCPITACHHAEVVRMTLHMYPV